MKVRILGAHNIESKDTACASILIDGVLALDAGALTSRLTLKAQQKLKALLLTHRHFDHVKDLPNIGMNFWLVKKSLQVYTARSIFDDVSRYLFDGTLYPDFTKQPSQNPALKFNIIEPRDEFSVGRYKIVAFPVNHSVPCFGYQVASPDGKKLFYTSDTGPGLGEVFRQVNPDMLIIELTSPDEYQDFAIKAGHLTPSLLGDELDKFRKMKGYLPRTITLHGNPLYQREIAGQLEKVCRALNLDVIMGKEGMRLDL
jgi:ribonuclease BN (tRNA processing enzyme)